MPEDRGGEASTSWQVFQQRTLHAASQERGGSTAQQRCFRPVAELAAAATAAPPARPRKKKKPSARLRRLHKELDRMSPEEREKTYAALWYKRLMDHPELEDDRVVRRRRREVLDAARNEKILASGLPLEPQIRSEPRALINRKLDPYKIRPGAYKMVLPPEEEKKLALDQFGTGIQLSPRWPWGYRLGGKEDFVFGMFGRSDYARAVLERQWAGRDPDQVIWDQDFYEDVLDNAHNIELTLMVQTLRPLPLAQLRRALTHRMSLSMRGLPIEGGEVPDREQPPQEVPLDEADTAAMEAFQSTFDEKRLATSEPGKLWVDKKGNVKEGTHLFLNVGPKFELRGEVMTPGNLRDRRTFHLGVWRSRRLARAAFDLFLGEFPVDARAKYMSGQCILYVTNGFKLGPNPDNPNQQLHDEQGNILPEPTHRPPIIFPTPHDDSGWALGEGRLPLLDGLRRGFQDA
ncbi:hypothetical protein WJX81_000239 [Elliptochloris bilobata]|uniref:Uncharacterized protein n=1 Tax=Elliptochloris bilobata TaxID=381761 RepID=A0AAW1QLR7_9CHLO